MQFDLLGLGQKLRFCIFEAEVLVVGPHLKL